MSNPYRVRPTRSRVDTNFTGYGIHNQKPWNPGSVQRPPSNDSNTTFQPPIANQTKLDDSWDWNADNGNNGSDSWNWSIEQPDQQSHQNQHQQQQHQQQQQQQQPLQTQFIPPFTNPKQSVPPPTKDGYYKNLNGNNRINIPPIPHGSSVVETPRTAPPIRELPSKQPDSFPQYTNYSQNQQFSGPPRPNSNTSYSGSIDQPQWSNEQHNQNSPYTSQHPIHSQKNQSHQTPLPPPPVNNFNWTNTDQQSCVAHNWPNHTEIPTSNYWQEPSITKQEQLPDNANNPWPHQSIQTSRQSQQKNSDAFLNTSTTNNDQSKFYNNPHEPLQENMSTKNWIPQNTLPSNQWQKANSENITNVLPRQQSLPSNTWSQVEEANSLPPCQQAGMSSNIPQNQWRQPKLQSGGSLEESTMSENNKSEWQQIHAIPSHFNSSTTSTTSGSLANMSSSTEQLEDRKRSPTPTTSSTSLNEFQTQTSNTNQIHIENNVIPNIDNFHGQNNADVDWNRDDDWNTINELSADVSNMSVSHKFNHHIENTSSKIDQPTVHSGNDWGCPIESTLKSNNIEKTPDNAPILVSKHNSMEVSTSLQDQFDIVNPSSSKSTENISQTNYDQWYNQNVHTQPDKEVFSNDRAHSIKQWPSEQNVENYENIQQSSEFVNLEVVAPELQERDIYGSHDSINKETLENDQVLRQANSPKETTLRDFRQEATNIEVPTVQQIQQPIQAEQAPDNYEFASNDRNTFLETGELTDTHSQEYEFVPLSQDDENDEVPSDIPFLREVPGQSSNVDPRRNDPTGQEQYPQGVGNGVSPRISDPRRNDPSGQEQQQLVSQTRAGILIDRATDRRDVPSGQERVKPLVQQQQQQQQRIPEVENVERRNDPSGRERSLPPPLPPPQRNEPSGEEQRVVPPIVQVTQLEPATVREIPGRGNELEETIQQSDSTVRQIPGGASSNESMQIIPDERLVIPNVARVVTGSQQVNLITPLNTTQDSSNDNRNKREEAVGASVIESQQISSGLPNRRDSYEDGDDEGSGNSREESRDRCRESSPKPRISRFEYNRKPSYYDRERDYEDDYYYDRRRTEFDRTYNSREDLDRRDVSYREDDRRHASRDDLDRDRHPREDLDRRSRLKDDIDERDGRRRIDERRRERSPDQRRLDREGREFDPRYPAPRDRDFIDRDRDRRRDDRRLRRYPEYDQRDPRENYRRDYYDDAYARNSRPSSRSSYNDRERDYYGRSRDPYSSYGYNSYQGYEYGPNYNSNYYAYLENLRRTDPAAYAEWYHKYYQHQQQVTRGVATNYSEDRASVHSGRSSCDDREFPDTKFTPICLTNHYSYFGCSGWTRSSLGRRNDLCGRLNRNSSDKRNLTDLSLMEDQTTASSRMTPTKFSSAHAKGIFSIGALLHVHASYPSDGERAKIDVLKMEYLLPHDSTLRELRSYPGPLIKGVTHKKTIIDYCENKIKKASSNDDIFEVSSYVLLYELMILLIQQNGNVVGVDIATLLLKNKENYPYEINKAPRANVRRESTISQRSSGSGGEKGVTDVVQSNEKEDYVKPRKTMEQLTDEFRNTLLYGLVQEALEFAMVEGLWGHALFLASKLDKRTHASVMTRFANSLPPQDPLQTLYQLHSGRIPASVTCVSDAKWDDWRPHLAMIISNTSANPDVNRRSISSLGDTLATRGDIYAAHFCYILSQVDFGSYGSNNVKLVLIGANHHKSFNEFISTEAIMLTEIYEYARKLSEPFTLVDLQTFKFNLAVKMVDYGLLDKALLYIEQVALNIFNEPEKYEESFINNVYILGDRLKYHDPVYKDSDEDVANLSWLKNLLEIMGKYEKGEIIQDNNHCGPITSGTEMNMETNDTQQIPQKWNTSQAAYNGENNPLMMRTSDVESHATWQSKPPMSSVQESYNVNTDRELQYNDENVNEIHQQQQHYQSYQQDYWALQQQQQQQQTYEQSDYANREYSQSEWHQSSNIQYQSDQQAPEHLDHQNKWAHEQQQQHHQQHQQMDQQQYQPNISMGPTSGKQYDPLEELESLEPSRMSAARSGSEAKKQTEKGSEKKPNNGGNSWFGGLFSKLAPKPKNQMILPDDSNPAIVWDPVAKKWMNKEEEDGVGSTPLAPPPKLSDITNMKQPAVTMNQSIPPSSMPSSALAGDETLSLNSSKLITGSGNMYKLSRSRNMRANYVDVMNSGNVKANNTAAPAPGLVVPTPAGSPATPIAASSPQLFMPAPVNDPNAPVDFLTPLTTPAMPQNENSQPLSRWSSTSSLSREVQSYTMRDPRLLQRDKGPMMYNPVDMKDRSQKNHARSRYPPR